MYLTNRHGYYFAIDASCFIDIANLDGCHLHSTQKSMYQYVCTISRLILDEVVGNDIGIRNLIQDRGYSFCDSRGCWSDIDFKPNETIESWLSEFTL